METSGRFHIGALVICKLSSRKFTSQNDLEEIRGRMKWLRAGGATSSVGTAAMETSGRLHLSYSRTTCLPRAPFRCIMHLSERMYLSSAWYSA